jgi:hypothetical protein
VSGLNGSPGKTVYQKWYRGFKSRPFRFEDYKKDSPGFCEEQKSASVWRTDMPAMASEVRILPPPFCMIRGNPGVLRGAKQTAVLERLCTRNSTASSAPEAHPPLVEHLAPSDRGVECAARLKSQNEIPEDARYKLIFACYVLGPYHCVCVKKCIRFLLR